MKVNKQHVAVSVSLMIHEEQQVLFNANRADIDMSVGIWSSTSL